VGVVEENMTRRGRRNRSGLANQHPCPIRAASDQAADSSLIANTKPAVPPDGGLHSGETGPVRM